MSSSSAERNHPKLKELAATAICGNDILSSTLYVSGIAALFAGAYAPIVLIIVSLVLFLYKSVYTEVVEALPINGGAYNCLLNGTSKTIAAIAGVTTFLSYVATAVISAKVGVEYLNTILHVPILPATVVLLLLFALLVIGGMKDSAKVAVVIFLFHIAVLSFFLLLSIKYAFHGQSHLMETFAQTKVLVAEKGGLLKALYLAFAASLLGVSGFESSANFVEEQESGVFRKTLRNMLLGVAIFNPLIALGSLNAMKYDSLIQAKDFLLAEAGSIIGGPIFHTVVAIDAFLVLAGAVLTAYVGVSGLVYRMSADNCLPRFFMKQNKRSAYPRIVLGFFILCSSILLITRGDLLSLAGVYTIAFLGVMSSFAFGNLILKEARKDLKRTYSAPIFIVILAFFSTFLGVIGNIRIDQKNLIFFEIYFIPALILVLTIVYQDYVMRFLLRTTLKIRWLNRIFQKMFASVTSGKFIVYVRHPSRLYKTLEYINRNETGRNVLIVHCYEDEPDNQEIFEEMKTIIKNMKRGGVFPQLEVSLVHINKPFDPSLVESISKEFQVEKNRMFIGSIHNKHNFEYNELGGVRIIF